MNVVDILIKYWDGFVSGVWVTLQLCLIIWSSGLILGSILGFFGAKWDFTLGLPSQIISFVLSGIPILVLLFWLHYPLQAELGIVIDPFYTAATALSIVNIFTVADVVRGVLKNFPSQYIIAAKVCGISPYETAFKIQLPIIFREIIPSLLILQVNMLQATLFASLISVNEIFRVAQQINAMIYRPVEIYTGLAFFFLAICLPLNGLALWLKQRFTRDLSDK